MYFWLPIFIAFITSFLVTPLVIKLAGRFGFVDQPNRPHPAIIHKKVGPRAGGLPPLIGFVVALLLTALLIPTFTLNKALLGIMVASLVVVFVGSLDDKYDINPYQRLLANFVVGLIVVAFGIGITSFTNPFGGFVRLDSIILTINLPAIFGIFAGAHHLILLADLVALFWIIWIMNAMNWSSGVDGQLSGIAVIALAILGLASAQLISKDPAQIRVSIIAFAAAGAFFGFLPWSFYPQKIMPGYGGSTLAGFLIATLSILSGAKLAIALLILLIPLVDSFWAVVRRISGRHSPVWGDNFHLHHQLLKMGFSIPQVCLLYYSVSLLLGLLALNLNSKEKFFAISIVGVIIFALLYSFFVILRRVALKR